jgi:hypothetical protein
MVNHFQNDVEVEVMDNVQERLYHWSHVLCTPDIG